MNVIDADAHVIETERTWSFMLEEDRRFAPELLVSSKNGVEYWRIDERVFPNSNLGLNVPEESRDLTDVPSRLGHMDSLGIDIQVLYPSLFLRPLTARAEVELALCRGYNRWLAQIWKLGKGRLRWIVLPPLRCMDRAIEEINFGKANGACGVFMRASRGSACYRIALCFLSMKRRNGSTCRFAFTPAQEILVTTISLDWTYFHASSFHRWVRSIT